VVYRPNNGPARPGNLKFEAIMGVDIRLPIGGMFSIFGVLLLVYGIYTRDSDMYARSLDYNVNIWWGLVMLVFGGLMLGFGLRKKSITPRSTGASESGDSRPAQHH
jgi:hypothetical protein